MSDQVPGTPGDSDGGSADPNQAPPPAANTPPNTETPGPSAKVEIKDGVVTVDGKKYVAESHLIAAKNNLEGKLTQQQNAHDVAINEAKLKESAAQQEIAALNAKLKENEEARAAGAVSDEEAAGIKQELESAKSRIETLTAEAAKALDYRRALLVVQYGVPADSIKDKDAQALDAFEEAVKAVATAKGGVGPYAIGGGGEDAVPKSDIERATKILEGTPVLGVRNAQTG